MPPATLYDPHLREGVGVDFGVLIDGQVVHCRISTEALSDHFAGGDDPLVQTYVQHRDEIDARAIALFRTLSADGQIVWTRADPLVLQSKHF